MSDEQNVAEAPQQGVPAADAAPAAPKRRPGRPRKSAASSGKASSEASPDAASEAPADGADSAPKTPAKRRPGRPRKKAAPAQKAAQHHAGNGDQGQKGVAEGMAPDHRALPHALGADGADIVLTDGIQHGGAGKAKKTGGIGNAEGQRGQNPTFPAVYNARSGYPMELPAENQHADGGDTEGGNGGHKHGEGGKHPVSPGVLLYRRQHTQRDADD